MYTLDGPSDIVRPVRHTSTASDNAEVQLPNLCLILKQLLALSTLGFGGPGRPLDTGAVGVVAWQALKPGVNDATADGRTVHGHSAAVAERRQHVCRQHWREAPARSCFTESSCVGAHQLVHEAMLSDAEVTASQLHERLSRLKSCKMYRDDMVNRIR